MKIAVVGLGPWSLKILDSLRPAAEAVGVVTRRVDARGLLPAGCQVFQELPFLWNLDIDGIIVANQSSKHVPTLRAIWAHAPNMPVFVEKPVGMCVSDVETLSRESAETCVFLVDHLQLFNEHLLAMKADLGGPPDTIHGMDGNNGPIRADCNALWDYGPHAVAIALYLAGFPVASDGVRVRDVRMHRSDKGEKVDFELQIGAKTVASLMVGSNFAAKARAYSATRTTGEVYGFDGLAACRTPPLTAALQAFCHAIEAGRPPDGDPRWGWTLPLAVTRVLGDLEALLAERGTPL